MMTKRRLTGIKATGISHLGNYFASFRPFLHVKEGTEYFYFIANYHALTSERDGKALIESTYDIVATILALGLDTQKVTLFRQSDVPEVLELSWILSNFAGMGLLERAHAYKDAVAKQRDVHVGLFTYPVLMAADILLYDIDEVPVGKDQKQHIEMTRDIGGAFNFAYGRDIFRLPKPIIDENLMIVPGLDGQKMSKSYGNTIAIFEDEALLRKKIMAIPTDSTSLEAPKDVNGSVVFALYGLFATPNEIADFRKRMMAGGMGWGHAKEELFEKIRNTFAPYRDTYRRLKSDYDEVDRVLEQGAARARELAMVKMSEVRRIVGLSRF